MSKGSIAGIGNMGSNGNIFFGSRKKNVIKLSCGPRLVQLSLILSNLAVFAVGVAIFSFGIYLATNPKYNQFSKILGYGDKSIEIDYLSKCDILFMVSGGILLLISFFGCCGALKQIRFLLVIYGLTLTILFMFELSIGFFAALQSSKFKDAIAPLINQSIKTQYMGDMNNKTIVSVAWDSIMYNLECCGFTNFTDFDQPNNAWTERNSSIIAPRACCKFRNRTTDWSGKIPFDNERYYYPACVNSPNNAISNYHKGCYQAINKLIEDYNIYVLLVFTIIGSVLLCGVLFSFFLCQKIKNLQDYV